MASWLCSRGLARLALIDAAPCRAYNRKKQKRIGSLCWYTKPGPARAPTCISAPLRNTPGACCSICPPAVTTTPTTITALNGRTTTITCSFISATAVFPCAAGRRPWSLRPARSAFSTATSRTNTIPSATRSSSGCIWTDQTPRIFISRPSRCTAALCSIHPTLSRSKRDLRDRICFPQ